MRRLSCRPSRAKREHKESHITAAHTTHAGAHWEHTFVVRVVSGTIAQISVDPGPIEVPYQFAIRASAHTWGEFGKPVPAPMYHGIWAATFQRDMKLEGDVLVLMQNLRCLTRQIELLRSTGAPV